MKSATLQEKEHEEKGQHFKAVLMKTNSWRCHAEG